MIKYLGSKRTLLEDICSLVRSVPNATSVLDLFSGTSRVGHALKRQGYRVISNDINSYAHVLATCYVQADRETYERSALKLIAELERVKPSPGYFTETFCEKSRFFQPHNGEVIDAIRERIETLELDAELKAICLVSLMEAADRVDSTTGVQMAYLKQWAPRSFNRLQMRLPLILPAVEAGVCLATKSDALDAARCHETDIAYLDPPYNQHSYLGNYHIWESLVLWDKPEVYGVACKRVDCRERSSVFNSRPNFESAFQNVVRSLNSKVLIVSFNNEGFLSQESMERILGELGQVIVIEKDYKRYVGAQIGIYNPSGMKVGDVSHLSNKELIYVCDVAGCLESVVEHRAAQGVFNLESA